jgi:myxalamid-type polyketide synthase MxaE and MxaD
MSSLPPGTVPEASLVKQALAALRTLQSQLDEERGRQVEPIAILGMSCRYPGAADPDALWQILLSGADAITDVPENRWNTDGLYDGDVSKAGKLPTRRGGFLKDLDRMDAAFFGISPREAPHVDPRQRILLEIAWEALEDAGIPPDALAGSRTGVFMATLTNDYDHLLFSDLRRAEIYSGAGTANSLVANRLSYFLDLHGPSVALDTACSGSLVAVHLACESLRSGESTLALAGGVSINLMAKSNVFFARSGALSPAGVCRTFDAAADGIVRSDGAGIVVLKRLSAALRDSDPVLAVIRGSAVNHDGRSNGIMAPNGEAQRAVLAEAYRRAGVSASAVQYVELHGTGTPLGDPVEAQALLDVLGAGRLPQQECLVGSLKSNVGHSEAAAGVGAIIKTVLCMRNRKIPATAHFQALNPMIPFAGTPFRVAQNLESWPANLTGGPALAGVSGFGFGGTNTHVVLVQAPQTLLPATSAPIRPAYILPVSAADSEALSEITARYAELIAKSQPDTKAVCAAAAQRRSHLGMRIAAVGASRDELAEALLSSARRAAPSSRAGRMAFVFSGQGSHWQGMGRELDECEPVFHKVIDECEELLLEQRGWSLRSAILNDGLESSNTPVVQPAIFAVQAALGELWRSWGMVPDCVVGHSLGEAAAAHFTGVHSLKEALRIVVQRSRLMKSVAGCGKTAVVGLSLAEAEQAVHYLLPHLSIAGTNSPSSSVVSGTPEAIAQLMQEMNGRGILCREVARVDIAFHSPQMDPLREELVAQLADLQPCQAQIQIISTVTGKLQSGESFDAVYWGRNLREPFLFTQATNELFQMGCDTFLEVSPHPVLSSSILQTARSRARTSVVALSSLRKGREDELRCVYETLASLYTQGKPVKWRAVYPHPAVVVPLPHYPWQRRRYWFDQLDNARLDDSSDADERHFSGESNEASVYHPLLGTRIDVAPAPSTRSSVTLWQNSVSDHAPAYLADHIVRASVMMPAAAWLEMAREAGEQIFGNPVAVEEVHFVSPLRLNREPCEIQTVLTRNGEGANVEMFSRAQDGDWIQHVHASICPQPASIFIAEEDASRNRASATFHRTVTAQNHFAAMHEMGLEYGPAFRLLTEIASGESEAVGSIRLPEDASVHGYGIHPAMLDAALQLAAVAQGETKHGYLPVAVKRFSMMRRVDRATQCRAVLRGKPGDARLEADLLLFDETGRTLVELDGLALQRLEPHNSDAFDQESALIRETWIAQPRLALQIHDDRKWLLFAGIGELPTSLAVHLSLMGQSAALVYPGPEYRRVDDSHFELAVGSPAEIARLLSQDAWVGVVILPGADERFAVADLAGCGVALAVAKAKVALQSGSVLRLITRGGQAAGAVTVDPWQTPAAALALCIAIEHPELQVSVIDLDPNPTNREVAELAEELFCGGDELRIALRGGQRLVSRIEPLKVPLESPSSLNAGATYLVTGGLGSLGIAAAKRLIRDGARNLVLTSRSAIDSAAIDALRAMGATVFVTACDLAHTDQVDRLFHETLAALPMLRGVIHAAGVTEDALLPNQSPSGFRRVMAAKLAGAWNLHKHTESLPLDFFVLYSSAASLIGSAGQSNYAAANGFLDALAHHRRSLGLPAISLNWGAWGGSGMAAHPEVVDRLKAQGVGTIPFAAGLNILSAVCAGAHLPAQIGIFPAQWERYVAQLPARMRTRLSPMAPESSTSRTEDILALLSAAQPSEASAVLNSYLRRILARVLGFKNDTDVRVERPLFEMGMDSLTAVEFRNRLQEELQVPLPATLAFDYPDIASLARFLRDVVAPVAAPLVKPPAVGADLWDEAHERAALEAMTSDDLAQLLVEEMAEGGSHGR